MSSGPCTRRAAWPARTGDGKAARLCVVDSEAWNAQLVLKGLPILSGSMPGHVTVPLFDGTIILKEETDFGEDTD